MIRPPSIPPRTEKLKIDASSNHDLVMRMSSPILPADVVELEEHCSETRTSAFPLLEGEIEYNESHRLPLRKLAHGWLAQTVEFQLFRNKGSLPAYLPGIPNYREALETLSRHWEEAGQPTGQMWVELFFAHLPKLNLQLSPQYQAHRDHSSHSEKRF